LCKNIDISQPQKFDKRECTISLEVGEHIPKIFEQNYLDNIISSSHNIILSWAILGQGGYGHVNCRNNDYIIDKFNQFGYRYNMVDSLYLRYGSSLTWFKNTIMVFNRII